MLKLRLDTKLTSDQAGFTILELLIATAVFATVLVMLTLGIIQITRSYYKGTTETSTQNVARDLMNSIAQSIQFNGGLDDQTTASPSAGTTYAFCVGNQEYEYQLGYEVVNTNPNLSLHQAYHAVVVNENIQLCPTIPSPLPDLVSTSNLTGTELLTASMRLSELDVTPTAPGSNVYNVFVQVTYGADDLLNNPTATNGSTTCNGQTGSQFCAVAKLHTTVEKRIQ